MRLETSAYYRDMVGSGELWIGADGLPLRQILNMRFPEQDGEIVQAEMVTNYSRFGPVAGVAPASSAWNVPGVLAALRSRLPVLAGTLGLAVVVVPGLLFLRRRGRLFQALSVALVILLVANPLMRQLQAADAAAALAETAATQEKQKADSRNAEALRESLAQTRWNPHADPLKETPLAAEKIASAGAAAGHLVQVTPEATPFPPVDPGTDTDGDGLTDFVEVRVGTNPNYSDTDEDAVPDVSEVKGFDFGGQHWYMDANATDTNNDGVSDGVEYNFNQDANTPDDTDGDRIPDVFDDDNDGDGVPDAKDLSPFKTGADRYTSTNPFRLTIQNLQAGTPTFVDFQVRPDNPDHLWYAHQVLDWPSGDEKGQLRDIDGATFGSLPIQDGAPVLASSEYNGDMKLIPMLEIRIPDGANLPPQPDLTSYNIFVTEYPVSQGVKGKAAYVPLTVITDDKTGARVAFSARMRYLPGAGWTTPHEVRLVWIVQMLVDTPCDYTSAAPSTGCQDDNYIHNVRQVVQSYEDDWRLTGLNVKEDHGASVAMIYEDPEATVGGKKDDPLHDETLVGLVKGLDQAFLGARTHKDAQGQDVRDVDLAELVRRFDRFSNSGVSLVERWGLVSNVLRVERADYPTLDQATMTTAMTETLRVLDGTFSNVWQTTRAVKPLIMYAEEMASRGIGLDVAGPGGPMEWGSAGLTVRFQEQGQGTITAVSLKWTPYCPSGDQPHWSPCPMEDWWITLEERYDYPDPDLPDGRAMVVNIFAAALMQGTTRVVKQDELVLSQPGGAESDDEVTDFVQEGLTYGTNFVNWSFNQIFMANHNNENGVLKYLGNLKNDISTAFTTPKALFGNSLGSASRAPRYSKPLIRPRWR